MYEQLGSERARHEMALEKTHASGAEEWYCPTCGRRVMIEWAPQFNRMVLEPGDDNAAHNGSKGGLVLQSPQLAAAEEEPSVDDSKLTPWIEWLDEINFDSLWSIGE